MSCDFYEILRNSSVRAPLSVVLIFVGRVASSSAGRPSRVIHPYTHTPLLLRWYVDHPQLVAATAVQDCFLSGDGYVETGLESNTAVSVCYKSRAVSVKTRNPSPT